MADKAEKPAGKKLPQYIAAVCVCIGALGTGTVIGWTSNISDKIKDGQLNGIKDVSDTQLGWIGASMCLGACLMCSPIGILADIIGRKWCVLSTLIPFIIGWVLILFMRNIYLIYVGRFLTGVAGGSFCVLAPLYTSEIAQTEIRGQLGTFLQLFITLGILYANFLGWCLTINKSLFLFNAACTIIPIIFGIVFFFQPESPVFDLKKGKTEQAEKSYRRLRGEEYDFREEVKLVQEAIAKEAAMEKFSVVFKTKPAKKATLICFMLMFYQQLSGINAVMFYMKEIFVDAESSIPEHFCVIIIGAVQVVATLVATGTIEKLGRKILLMASAGLMALSSYLLALYFSLKNHHLISAGSVKTISFLPVMSLVIFIIAFSIGMGPIPWLASSELFPTEIMAKCSAAAGTFNWFLAFLITLCYPLVAAKLGNDITFYFFGTVSLTAVFFVWFFIPETKGKSFAEIQAELDA